MANNKIKYYFIINSKINNYEELLKKTNIFQWLNTFNGKIIHYRALIHKLSKFNKTENIILNINLQKENITLIKKIINLKKSNNIKIIVTFNQIIDELKKEFKNIKILFNLLNKVDLIMGNDSLTVLKLNELLNTNIYEIQYPANFHYTKNIKSKTENVISIIWDKKENQDIDLFIKATKNITLKKRLIIYNEINYKKLIIYKNYFNEIKKVYNYNDLLKQIKSSKIIFCFYKNYASYCDYIPNCAILGVPVIGSNRIESIRRCYKFTCVNPSNIKRIKSILKSLIHNNEYYNYIIKKANSFVYFYSHNIQKSILNTLFNKENSLINNYVVQPKKKENYLDTDLTFFLHVCKDYKLSNYTLIKIRKLYPKSQIIIISDGDKDKRYKNFKSKYNIEFKYGKKLISVKNGGKYIKRIFKLYLKKPTKYFFKIDPDTDFHRRFYYLPDCPVFGSWNSKKKETLQGGFIGFKYEAIKKIMKSKFLDSKELKDYKNTWGKYWKTIHILKEDKSAGEFGGLISDDFLISYCCEKLNIKMEEFDEVKSKWRIPIENNNNKYAVTHPCTIKYYLEWINYNSLILEK